MEQCFHHEKNSTLKKKGFINGACVIRWDVPCGGTPDSVPEPYICPNAYVPISKIEASNKISIIFQGRIKI